MEKWLQQMPDEMRQVLSSVPMLNSLREHRNRLFQMVGMYDGAMSQACIESFKKNYETLDALITALQRANR